MLSFIGIQFYMKDDATVPLRIIKIRTIWAGAFFSFTIMGSFFTLLFYVRNPFHALTSKVYGANLSLISCPYGSRRQKETLRSNQEFEFYLSSSAR